MSAKTGYLAMNRKQRRMAAKQGKQIPIPAAQGVTIGASVRIAELLATALRHHQAGQLAEAGGTIGKSSRLIKITSIASIFLASSPTRSAAATWQ
jgi:hypothetical protein